MGRVVVVFQNLSFDLLSYVMLRNSQSCFLLNPPPEDTYSQWQSQTVARREEKCHAPANNQFYIHDNSPADIPEERPRKIQNPVPNYENIILRT